ncbi:MAG: hypothetical protein RL514_1665 [Verrucomicrobiota bacterium]|jgi:hypothetical protein
MRLVAAVGLLGLPLLVAWSAVGEHRIAPVAFDSWALIFAQSVAIGLATLLLPLWFARRFSFLNHLPLFLFLTVCLITQGRLGSSLTERSVPNLRTGYDRDYRLAVVRQAEAIPRTGFVVAVMTAYLGLRILQRRKTSAPQSQAA